MRSRRILITLIVVSAVCMAFIAAPPIAYDGEPAFVANPVEYVDTLIGTGTGGETVGEINNFPGASVPFGMVQYSPDTVDTYAGYDHDNSRSTGFSMTHASVGCAAFGDISMLPTTTPIGSQPWNAWERIAHDDTELGVPGYYTVRFPGTGVTAELTATTRTGVGRFSYPRNRRPALFHVRSGASLAGNSARDHPDRRGQHHDHRIGDQRRILRQEEHLHGVLRDEVQPAVHLLRLLGRLLRLPRRPQRRFRPSAGATWSSRPARCSRCGPRSPTSSVDGARANLAAEGRASFDDVRAAASAEWNAALSRITVAGSDGDNLATFYTALYRSLLHPNTFNDADGRYIGFDGVHPHRGRRAHPVRQLLRLGHLPGPGGPAGTAVSRSRPATWPNRW